MSKSEYREHYEKVNNFNLKKCNFNSLNLREQNILWALQLRCSYGGMKGDIEMINYFTKIWYERFNSKFILEDNCNVLTIEDLRIITLKDIHVSSVDFHCTNIIHLIKNKYPNYSDIEIKNAIWHNRSKKNYRVFLKDDNKLNDKKQENTQEFSNIWNEISKYTNYISKVILRNYFID
jgi:hypothetical protein